MSSATTVSRVYTKNYYRQGRRDGFHSWLSAVMDLTSHLVCCFHWIWMLEEGNHLFRDILNTTHLSPPISYDLLGLLHLCPLDLMKSSMWLKGGPIFHSSMRPDLPTPSRFIFISLFEGHPNKLTVKPVLWLWQKGVSPVLPPAKPHASWTEVGCTELPHWFSVALNQVGISVLANGLWNNTPLCLLTL